MESTFFATLKGGAGEMRGWKISLRKGRGGGDKIEKRSASNFHFIMHKINFAVFL